MVCLLWGGGRPAGLSKDCVNGGPFGCQKLEALFADIIREGGYIGVDARALATGYSALIDGLHLGLLVTPRELTKRRARTVARDFLRRAFPRHID